MMFDIGRVCMKIAGRDAGNLCVVVENNGQFVVVDGYTRRRKVSIKHLEPLNYAVKVPSGADAKALQQLVDEVTTN